MRPRPLEEIARACGGRIVRSAASPGGGQALIGPTEPDARGLIGPDVVIDSRRATPGSLFVAFPGERVDGHDYVAAASAAGSAAAITQRQVEAPIPCVIVEDPQRALAALARHVVATSPRLSVIGVTGSSGKTSTKDLIAQVLATAGPTVAPVGSFNNEIGAPLTATRCDDDTRFLVAEMGARGQGHIAYLCSITPPTVAVVLNVGHAHLGEFGSRDAIARAKGELVEAVGAGGWAILNGDDARVSAMASRTRARIARFAVDHRPSDGGDVEVWSTDAAGDDLDRWSFRLHILDGSATPVAATPPGGLPVRLQGSGAHQIANALAAAAVAYVSGLAPDAVATALAGAAPRSHWRMERLARPDGVLILNDSYNANPESMAAGLHSLARIGAARRVDHPRARTWALVGDMLELGDTAVADHEAVGALAARLGITDLVAIGEFAEAIVRGARQSAATGDARGTEGHAIRTTVVPDRFAMARAAAPLGPGDVVLVKASRGLGLDTVATDLAAVADETGDVA